ncbi:UdgX family uracil-DNA binding protein [Achromobacter aloeverae]
MNANAAGAHRLLIDGSYVSWREQALRALAAHWAPEDVQWLAVEGGAAPGDAQMTLDGFVAAETPPSCRDGDAGDPPPAGDTDGTGTVHADAPPVIRVSRTFAELMQDAALYRSPRRWDHLYRALWRWRHDDRAVASPADEDGARLYAMAKAVRRAKHDMIAYVRFHRRAADDGPEYLAWYEPEHDVLPWAAEHFARRMGASTWCIATPAGAAFWDGASLRYSAAPVDGAAAARAGAGADDIEPLWLAYYRSIFNPARLNESALRLHMPVRFWRGLPEAAQIPGMVAAARNGARRVGQARDVGGMDGKPVAVAAHRAQPQRDAPSSLDQCRRCDLWRNATHGVPGNGPASARIMLIGEQPGDQEDLAGKAFVGPAGRILDEALARAGIARDEVYVTNAVKHFKWIPRGKRRMHKTPAQREVDACLYWLDQELDRIRPPVIVTLGATALRAMVRRPVHMQDYLDQAVRLGEAWLVATWHPSYALRVTGEAEREHVIAAIAGALARARELASKGQPDS